MTFREATSMLSPTRRTCA